MGTLIERCCSADVEDRIHPTVAVMHIRLSREWVRLTWGEDAVSEDEGEGRHAEEDEEWYGQNEGCDITWETSWVIEY